MAGYRALRLDAIIDRYAEPLAMMAGEPWPSCHCSECDLKRYMWKVELEFPTGKPSAQRVYRMARPSR